jgi:hypothetical protein
MRELGRRQNAAIKRELDPIKPPYLYRTEGGMWELVLQAAAVMSENDAEMDLGFNWPYDSTHRTPPRFFWSEERVDRVRAELPRSPTSDPIVPIMHQLLDALTPAHGDLPVAFYRRLNSLRRQLLANARLLAKLKEDEENLETWEARLNTRRVEGWLDESSKAIQVFTLFFNWLMDVIYN